MPTFTFTMDCDGDTGNFANDVARAMRSAAEDLDTLGGSFDITGGGTIEDIQGRVLAAWEVTK